MSPGLTKEYEYRIFLSSGFDIQMRENRDLFRAELTSRFNMISGQNGINTYLIDFEYGIPLGTSKSDVIDICLSNVKESDLFMCILSERYGQQINISLLTDELRQMALTSKRGAENNSISILELEILTAIEHVPAVFFIQQGRKREAALEQLISELVDCKCEVYFFETYSELTKLAVDTFKTHIGIFDSDSFSNDLGRRQLFARKLRYYCDMDSAIAEIDTYVNGQSEKILLIEGEKGAGKTTAISYWIRKNEKNKNIKIVSWFNELGPTNYIGMLISLLKQIGAETSSCVFGEDAVTLLHKQLREAKGDRYVFIIDGADTIEDNEDPIGWLISQLSPSVKMIITATNPHKLLRNSGKIQRVFISPILNADLVQKIYFKEGKQYEYPIIKELLNEKCKSLSLRQLTLGVQQFLREVKYVSSTSTPLAPQWNMERIAKYLQGLNSEWNIFKVQYQYLKAMHFIKHLDLSIKLIACSERGLSANELSGLTEMESHFIHQFYFSLYSDEDMYYFPKEIREYIIEDMTAAEQAEARKTLVAYFRKEASDRAIIELYYQFTLMGDSDSLYKLLVSLHRWKIISSNTTLLHNTKAVIGARNWTRLFRHWLQKLKSNQQEYSAQEIYTAYSLAREIGRLNTAVEFMEICLERCEPSDYHALASCFQILSDLYDELDDAKAMEYIQRALKFMALAGNQIYPQNMADTYLMAASIFSHFAFMQNEGNQDEQFEHIRSYLQEAIKITDANSSMNSYLRTLSYHNAAYACFNISNYDDAYRYIIKALILETSDLTTRSNSLFLKGQICLELFRADKSRVLFLGEAEETIEESYSIENTYPNLRGIYERRETISKIYNLWADILCEKGAMKREDESRKLFVEAIEHVQKAIELDEQNQSNDIYRSYYNAGIYCLNACFFADLDFYVKGKHYARTSLKCALRCHNAQAAYDMADIFMLLSRLQRTKKRILSSHCYLIISVLIYKKYKTDVFPIDVEENFSPFSKVDRVLFRIENRILKCFYDTFE